MRPNEYEQLWALAVELAPTTRAGTRFGPARTFDCSAVGLILLPDEGRWEYASTPENADTFATTGGDGVHFSFLRLPDREPNDWPVVMTVPMGISYNLIVGASCLEFLSLGCRYGYFALEQLDYRRDETIAELQSGAPADPDSHREQYLLTAIRDRFNVQPWPNVRSRLDELHAQFHGLMQSTT